MYCPKCKTYMEKVVFGDIEVDRCIECKGIWFDALENVQLKKMNGSESIDIGKRKLGKQMNEVANYKCPKCNQAMVKMVVPGQNHIWYESCSRCYGVYFDAGEFKDYKEKNLLDKIKSFLTPER